MVESQGEQAQDHSLKSTKPKTAETTAHAHRPNTSRRKRSKPKQQAARSSNGSQPAAELQPIQESGARNHRSWVAVTAPTEGTEIFDWTEAYVQCSCENGASYWIPTKACDFESTELRQLYMTDSDFHHEHWLVLDQSPSELVSLLDGIGTLQGRSMWMPILQGELSMPNMKHFFEVCPPAINPKSSFANATIQFACSRIQQMSDSAPVPVCFFASRKDREKTSAVHQSQYPTFDELLQHQIQLSERHEVMRRSFEDGPAPFTPYSTPYMSATSPALQPSPYMSATSPALQPSAVSLTELTELVRKEIRLVQSADTQDAAPARHLSSTSGSDSSEPPTSGIAHSMVVSRDELSSLVRQEMQKEIQQLQLVNETKSAAVLAVSNRQNSVSSTPVRMVETEKLNGGFKTVERRNRRKTPTADSKTPGTDIRTEMTALVPPESVDWTQSRSEQTDKVTVSATSSAPSCVESDAERRAVKKAEKRASEKAEKAAAQKAAVEECFEEKAKKCATENLVAEQSAAAAARHIETKLAATATYKPPTPEPPPSASSKSAKKRPIKAKRSPKPPKATEGAEQTSVFQQVVACVSGFWKDPAPPKKLSLKNKAKKEADALDKAIEQARAERSEQRGKLRFEWIVNHSTEMKMALALFCLVVYQFSRIMWANMHEEPQYYPPATAPLMSAAAAVAAGPNFVASVGSSSGQSNQMLPPGGQHSSIAQLAGVNGGPWMPLPSGAYQRQLKLDPMMFKYYQNRDIFLFSYSVPQGPYTWENLLVIQVDREGSPLGMSAATVAGQGFYMPLGSIAQLGSPEHPEWPYHGWAKHENGGNGGLKGLVQAAKKLNFGARDTEAQGKVPARYKNFYCFLLPLVGVPAGRTDPEVLSVASMKIDRGDQVHQDLFGGLMPDDYILQCDSLAEGALLAERGSWTQYTLTSKFNKIFKQALPLFQQSPTDTRETMWNNMRKQKCSLPAVVPQPINFFINQAEAEEAFGNHRKVKDRLAPYHDLRKLLAKPVDCFQQWYNSTQKADDKLTQQN